MGRNSWAQKKCPMSCAGAGKFAGKPDMLGRKSARGMLKNRRKIDLRKDDFYTNFFKGTVAIQ